MPCQISRSEFDERAAVQLSLLLYLALVDAAVTTAHTTAAAHATAAARATASPRPGRRGRGGVSTAAS